MQTRTRAWLVRKLQRFAVVGFRDGILEIYCYSAEPREEVGAMRDRSTVGVKVVDRSVATSDLKIAVGLMLMLLTFSLLFIL